MTQTAQAGDKSVGETLGDDATEYYKDMKRIFSSPARFSTTQWLVLGSALGATASAYLVEEDVRAFAQENHTPFLDALMPVGDYYGRMVSSTALSSVIYLGGLTFDDRETRLTGRAAIEAVTFSLAITGVMKVLFGRSRPYTEHGHAQFNWLETQEQFLSFPSGHSTAAFALSSALSVRIDRPWATAGLYSLAAITLLNRMYDDKHWLSDTVMGAAIGTAIGIAVGKMVNKEAEQTGDEKVSGAPLEVPIVSVSF
ncbi:phosphatase PAP2 family protein [Chloroherpeton thalassium]|uniref:phosphatase PAP2 family protein n=1 Tax=Chloroherpeton thalassium TaxID=100716 RepID=UPI00145DCDAF|nr:phosphatase PAP2 family protein [Chloroherpeton thalassium]